MNLKLSVLSFILLLSSVASGKNQIIKNDSGAKAEVRFKFDSAVLVSSSYNILAEVISFINANKNNIVDPIEVNGYTDTTGDASYNLKLSKRRALSVANYMRDNGSLIDNFDIKGFGESTARQSKKENRRVEIIVSMNSDVADSTALNNDDFVAESNNQETEINNAPSSSFEQEAAYDKHLFGLGIAALNTELASETSTGNSASDEVLSEVRVAAELKYKYYLSPSFYITALAGLRWYEYKNDSNIFINETQTNWSYRFGLGLGYEIYEWWDINLMAIYDSQLYYFVSGPSTNREITFDMEQGVRSDLATTFRLYNGDSWDLKLGFMGGYLFGVEPIESGYSYGVRPSIGLMQSRFLELYALYQVNQFEVSSIDIKHEILEMGVSLNF